MSDGGSDLVHLSHVSTIRSPLRSCRSYAMYLRCILLYCNKQHILVLVLLRRRQVDERVWRWCCCIGGRWTSGSSGLWRAGHCRTSGGAGRECQASVPDERGFGGHCGLFKECVHLLICNVIENGT